MSNPDKSQSALARSLRRKQKKHERLLRKVEKTTARLERRRASLLELETSIADLERQLASPRKENLGRESGDDASLKRARLIFNPNSGRKGEDNAQRLAQVVASLRAHGIEPHVGLKTSGKVAREIARKAAKAGEDLVVVAAGDGTIGEVAAQLVGTSTVLGIVPIGTMNNIARSLGVPLGIDDACALIGMGTTRHIDVGRIVSNGGSHEYFMECVGVGLSAVGAMSGQAFEKRRWHLLPGALRKLFEARPEMVRVEMDGTVIEASTRTVTVSNAPLMGNNMLAAPGAKMDDGLLDVCIYDGMGETALLKHFMDASSHAPDSTRMYRAKSVRITSSEPLPANAGSDDTRQQQVIEIEVVPKALAMIVGNGIALSVPVESAPTAPTFAMPPAPHTNGAAAKPASTPTHIPSEA